MKNLLSYIEKGQLKRFSNYFEGNFSGLDADSTFVLEKGGPKRSVPWNHTLFSYSCRHGKLEICKYLSNRGFTKIKFLHLFRAMTPLIAEYTPNFRAS